MTGLTAGYHRVYFRVMDSIARWSLIRGTDFYVFDSMPYMQKVRPKIIAVEYFFDADPGPGKGSAIPFTPTADNINLSRYFPVAGLNQGAHTVQLRVKDEAGSWSIYKSNPFTVFHVSCTTPVPDFVTDTINSGSPTHFTNTSANITAGTSYQWDINNDGTIEYTSKNMTYTFPGSGVYTVKLTVINSDTCKSSVIHQVPVGPVPVGTITASGNTAFCKGDSVILSAAPGYIYKWWPTGTTTQSITVKSTGSYYVWVKTAAGLEIKSPTVSTVCHEKPVISVTVTNASGGASNGSAVVSVSGGSGIYSYQWSSGSTRFYANNLAPGNYQVQVSDGFCPVTASCIVENNSVADGNIVAAEYFFNTDPGPGNGIPVNIAAGDTVAHYTGFSIAGLPTGYNRLFIRTLDTRRRWSMYNDQTIFVFDTTSKVLTKQQPPVVSAEYFVDLDQQANPDPGVGNGSPVSFTPGDTVSAYFPYQA